MAIDIETFDSTPEDGPRETSNPERVLRFLVALMKRMSSKSTA